MVEQLNQTFFSHKQFIEEEELLVESFRLGAQVFRGGGRPTMIVGLWHGGAVAAVYLQECLQALGVASDHIAVKAHCNGITDEQILVNVSNVSRSAIAVDGLQYLLDRLTPMDKLLIVTDVYLSGTLPAAVIDALRRELAGQCPDTIDIAAIWYNEGDNRRIEVPDHFLRRTRCQIVRPFELRNLSDDERRKQKPFLNTVIADLERLGFRPQHNEDGS